MMQAKTKAEVVVRRDEYEYHVGVLNNKIYMYHKICYNRDHCHIWGSVLRLDTGLLEKYEVDMVVRANYKRLGIIVLGDNEVQQIKARVEQMLRLYNENRYNDVINLYSITNKYLDNMINKYVTSLKDAFYNLYDAVSLLAQKRKNEERGQYNLNIQATPVMVDMPVYDSRYGVTIYTSTMYVWRVEYPVPGYDYTIQNEIQIELDKGIIKTTKVRENVLESEFEYGPSVWLYENEVIVLEDYIEQLVDYIERYDYDNVVDILNNAAQYMRGLVA